MKRNLQTHVRVTPTTRKRWKDLCENDNKKKELITMNREKRILKMRLPSEMFYGRNLDQYWSEVKEMADKYDDDSICEENTWGNVVAGYIYNREVKGMQIEAAQKEVAKNFPWNGKHKTIEDREEKIKQDYDFENFRDLKELAYHVFGKPLEKIPEEDLWHMDQFIPPILQATWENYNPEDYRKEIQMEKISEKQRDGRAEEIGE